MPCYVYIHHFQYQYLAHRRSFFDDFYVCFYVENPTNEQRFLYFVILHEFLSAKQSIYIHVIWYKTL